MLTIRISAAMDDDHAIAAAVTARADLVVSGDQHLLSMRSDQGIRIVAVAEAVRALQP